MIEILKDAIGNIQGVCEFRRVNETGNYDKNGEYAYIANIEVNPGIKGNGAFKKMFPSMYKRVKGIKFVYFKRPKYRERVRLYRIEQFLKHLKESV